MIDPAIGRLIRDLSGEACLAMTREQVARLIPPDAHPDVRDYFQYCLTKEGYHASGIAIMGSEDIHDAQDWLPASRLRQFGFVAFATNVGGNAVLVNAAAGHVYWADHESFGDDFETISCPPPRAVRKSGRWTYVEGYTYENVLQALLLIETDFQVFLGKCLRGELREEFDAIG